MRVAFETQLLNHARNGRRGHARVFRNDRDRGQTGCGIIFQQGIRKLALGLRERGVMRPDQITHGSCWICHKSFPGFAVLSGAFLKIFLQSRQSHWKYIDT